VKALLFIPFFLLGSCAVLKGKNTVTVKGKIEIHRPYCGQGKPSDPEAAKGSSEPFPLATFYVKAQMNNDKKKETVTKFKTDENGNYEFRIRKGTYVVIHEDKTLPFEEYVKKQGTSTDKFLQYIGDDEARKLYQRLDFSLDLQENKEFNYKYKTRCFSGTMHLLRYTGPK
jgi:hypothetical protein